MLHHLDENVKKIEVGWGKESEGEEDIKQSKTWRETDPLWIVDHLYLSSSLFLCPCRAMWFDGPFPMAALPHSIK